MCDRWRSPSANFIFKGSSLIEAIVPNHGSSYFPYQVPLLKVGLLLIFIFVFFLAFPWHAKGKILTNNNNKKTCQLNVTKETTRDSTCFFHHGHECVRVVDWEEFFPCQPDNPFDLYQLCYHQCQYSFPKQLPEKAGPVLEVLWHNLKIKS